MSRGYVRDVLHISELAALINKNRYKTPAEAKVAIFKRLRPAAYDQAKTRTRSRIQTDEQVVAGLDLDLSVAIATREEHAATAHTAHLVAAAPLASASQRTIDQIAHILQNADALPEQTIVKKLTTTISDCPLTAEAQRKLTQSAHRLATTKQDATRKQITDFIQGPKVADCPQVKAQVEAVVNKRRGARHENPAITMYEQRTQTRVTDKNAQFYLCNVGDETHTCHIGGYVDGLRGDRVVEVKCRRNRLFSWLPEYEKVQIMAYMHVAGKDKCDLVQKFGNRLDIKTYEFDPVYWKQITADICAAWADLQHLFTSADEQDCLLQTVATN